MCGASHICGVWGAQDLAQALRHPHTTEVWNTTHVWCLHLRGVQSPISPQLLTTKHALRLSCALVHIYSCGNRNALKGSCLKYPPRMPKCPFLSPWMYFLLQHCVASKTPPEYLLLRGECFLTSRRREIAPQTMVNYITMSPMRRSRISSCIQIGELIPK